MELLNRKQNEKALKQFRAAPDVHATLSAEVTSGCAGMHARALAAGDCQPRSAVR